MSLLGVVVAVVLAGGLAGWLVKLHRSKQAHDLAMEGAGGGLWVWDPVNKRLKVGSRLLGILGYSDNFLCHTDDWLAMVHPEDRARFNDTVVEHLRGRTEHFYCEYRVRSKSSDYRWIASRGVARRNRRGRATLMAGSIADISEQRRSDEQLRYLAHYDQLTGLPNRVLLKDRLQQALAVARRHHQALAVMFIDLDRFKNINDTYGHTLGDQFLQAMARHLGEVLRASDTLVRQGGDEFIVLLAEVSGEPEALLVAEKLRQAACRGVSVQDTELFVSASIGIALYPAHGRDGEALLKAADTAMYEAKTAGGSAVRFFRSQMGQRMQENATVESRLRRALERGDLQLHFQPKVERSTTRICGAEALLRWQDPDLGVVAPDRFIAVAEQSGLILPLGDWVIERALAQLAYWKRSQGLRMAINLSPRQLIQEGLAERILERIHRLDLTPDRVEFEITESVLLCPDADTLSNLRRLAEAGVVLSLDDFGTGYSSLSYLRLLPLQVLKIDRSFVSAIGSGGEADALVHAIIAMAHSLHLSVVAEGVETREQREFLYRLDCDEYQGYLFGRPVPAGEFARLYLADSGGEGEPAVVGDPAGSVRVS